MERSSFKFKISWSEFIVILVISIIISTLNILHVLIGSAKTPDGMVYLWTGQYYLDYFEYVQAISQGGFGRWIWENYFTIDGSKQTIFGISQYLFWGKIGKLLHLSPIASYWFFIVCFTLILAFLIFIAIKKLIADEPYYKQVAAFLLALFAAPFFKISIEKGNLNFFVFHFWNDKSVLFQRFGSIIHHLAGLIGVLLAFFLVDSFLRNLTKISFKKTIFAGGLVSLLAIFLLMYDPANGLLAVGSILLLLFLAVCVKFLKKQKEALVRLIVFLEIIFFVVLPAGYFIHRSLVSDYYAFVSKFEATWQIHPLFWEVVLVFGPLFFAAFFGIFLFLKRLTPIRILFLFLNLFSFLLFFSPLASLLGTTNARFLTPLNWVLWAILAVLPLKTKKMTVGVFFVLFLLFLPANILSLKVTLNDKNIFSPISYLPKDMIEGFQFLGTLKDKKNLLVTPSQFLGSVIPIYTDRHVFVARPNITPNYLEKNITASNFYLGAMDSKQAEELLKNNQIGYVVLTSIEGYPVDPLFKYSFLREIYRRKNIIIFKVI